MNEKSEDLQTFNAMTTNRLKPINYLIINFLRSRTLSTYLHLSFQETSFQEKKTT